MYAVYVNKMNKIGNKKNKNMGQTRLIRNVIPRKNLCIKTV